MKWLTLLLLFPISAVACQKGYIESDTAGVCIESPVIATNPEWVSNEKPPSDKMPSYEREGISVVPTVQAVEASTTSAHDYKAESDEK